MRPAGKAYRIVHKIAGAQPCVARMPRSGQHAAEIDWFRQRDVGGMQEETAMLDPTRSPTTELPPVPPVVDLDGILIHSGLLMETHRHAAILNLFFDEYFNLRPVMT
jgi:hypothetical protein